MIVRAMFRSEANHVFIAFVVAAILHLIVISDARFSVSDDEIKSESITFTMIGIPKINPPPESDPIVQQNQVESTTQLTKPESIQKKADINIIEKKLIKTNDSPKLSVPQKRIAPPKKPLNNKQEPHQQVVAKSNKTPLKTDTIEPIKKSVPLLTAESLQQQISQLGSEVRETQVLAEQTKIKAVDAIGAHKYVASQYIKDWDAKVERTGNLNFPAVANKKNFSASLMLDVEINSDGSVSAIRINRSSGIAALDEAAKNIVRMSAPFPPLPSEIVKDTNVFLITRVWTFSDESGLDTH